MSRPHVAPGLHWTAEKVGHSSPMHSKMNPGPGSVLYEWVDSGYPKRN